MKLRPRFHVGPASLDRHLVGDTSDASTTNGVQVWLASFPGLEYLD